MRRVLVLGGTGWLGRRIAAAALSSGAEVVCLARGETGEVPEGAQLIRADRNEPGAYDALQGEWDEVIELAYEPALVESALNAIAPRAAHWTLVSTVSVYARGDKPHADESAELVEPDNLAEYPDAKVAAERASSAHIGDRLLIARPGLIVGPGDPSDRFGYWPARLARGGQTLAPTLEGRHVQVIDVDDLASWLEGAGRDRVVGTINAVGDAHAMREFFGVATDACAFDGELVSVDDSTLLDHDVRYWSGPRSLPLWLPATEVGFAQRDNAAFTATGGTLRPLGESVERALQYESELGLGRPRRSGLTPTEESEVLAAVDAQGSIAS